MGVTHTVHVFFCSSTNSIQFWSYDHSALFDYCYYYKLKGTVTERTFGGCAFSHLKRKSIEI